MLLVDHANPNKLFYGFNLENLFSIPMQIIIKASIKQYK